MRVTCLVLAAVGLLGCGQVDPTTTKPVANNPSDNIAPAAPRTPTAATPTDTSTPHVVARPVTEPDNTAVNERDANRETRNPKLPIDQKENQADIDITAKIRQRVVGTDGLSINARNAKIITADGQVTLRGPVESQTEREIIARIAREVAGDANVTDQLEVKAASEANSSATVPSNP